ncbi:MAG: HEAT repeat domain-containing protein [Limisphaerales bacterium]
MKTNAAPALPELERFFKADSDSGRVWLAASSIGNLGDAALSFFLQIIADKPKSLHALAAIHGIGEMNYLGTNAVRAVPVLLHALENTNDAVMSRTAATTIGRLGVMPEKVMPALSNMFASPDSMRRRDAIQGILGLGEHANIPRTFIVDSLRDPDQLVHIFATHLARKFAPEVLTNSDANSFTFH